MHFHCNLCVPLLNEFISFTYSRFGDLISIGSTVVCVHWIFTSTWNDYSKAV